MPRVSVVIPCYNEGETIVGCLDRILESVDVESEIIVVFDDLMDTTRPWLEKYAKRHNNVIPHLNTIGPGPASAIKSGIARAHSPVVVVTMADGCDDATQIGDLTRLVERGVVVACASRYARTGQQVGGPFLKGFLSRLAGQSLYYFGRVGTRDATNSFKAYSSEFVARVGIESDKGFELGIELVAKARRHRLPIAEIPTIWLDRAFGQSNFKLWEWLPRYLKWYRYAFGPQRLLSGFSARPIPISTKEF
jgi:glycosyltransferase involved in cell wall biosynthesis